MTSQPQHQKQFLGDAAQLRSHCTVASLISASSKPSTMPERRKKLSGDGLGRGGGGSAGDGRD